MCCFSGSRQVSVSRTNIYARMLERRPLQVLAYGMDLAVEEEVAMVLPLPVPPGSGDDAVTFIDLHSSPQMFQQLAGLFVMPSRSGSRSAMPTALGLAVHKVGSFVASYVPTRGDFVRLDPRFRISEELFAAVPQYIDYGFAVFQLAPGRSTIHPMAFSFPTRDPDRLFFPTVHVHDGSVHPTAAFDHSLYYQHPRCTELGGEFGGDEVSVMSGTDTFTGVTSRELPYARRTMKAQLPNVDTWIAAS